MRFAELYCSFCLSDTCALRVDVRGVPFLSCACGARTFLGSWRNAIRTIALVQPMLAARAEELREDREEAARAAVLEAQVASALRAMQKPRTDVTTTAEATLSVAAGGSR